MYFVKHIPIIYLIHFHMVYMYYLFLFCKLIKNFKS